MNTLVRPPLADVLRSARTEFNARFVEMKRRHPDLDAEAFSAVLRTMVDPVAESVDAVNPERVPATVWAAYDAALVIVAEKLAGPGGRYPVIAEAWQDLLPAVASLVAEAPGRVMGAVTNALTQLASTPGVRAVEWTERLLTIAPELKTVDELLHAGQVAAWRCGLAHYREGALAAADTLPPAVALRLLGALDHAKWENVRDRLSRERWWNPAHGGRPEAMRIARTAGAFRGFGGLFIEPPIVAAKDEQIFVRSGDGNWLLTADSFGATFHRAEPAEFDAAAQPTRPPPLGLPPLGEISSVAETAHTIAVTRTVTHAITLLVNC